MSYDNSQLQTFKEFRNFLSKIELPSECWIWNGCDTGKSNYGRFRVASKKFLAHRISYQIFVDDIPNGMVIDHICRNRKCVNPKHLRVVTSKENIHTGGGVAAKNILKTHCKYGHEFSQENTRVVFFKKYKLRQCRQCSKDRKNVLR